MAKRAELAPKNLIVWDKGGSGLGSSYANTYELVGFFARLPKQTVMTSGFKTGQRQVHSSNVMRFDKVPGGQREHNAQKPVQLVTAQIELSSDPGQLVIDWFAGSGTTLIARRNSRAAGARLWRWSPDTLTSRCDAGRASPERKPSGSKLVARESSDE